MILTGEPISAEPNPHSPARPEALRHLLVEVMGTVEGVSVYHSSLSIDEYEVRFREVGLKVAEFVPEDRDCAGHSVLLAVRKASAQ